MKHIKNSINIIFSFLYVLYINLHYINFWRTVQMKLLPFQIKFMNIPIFIAKQSNS